MFERKFSVFFSCSLLALMVLIGCAPGNRPRKNTDLTWTVENPLASKGASHGAAQIVARDTTWGTPSSSSLDALRKGESTATPESSPLKDIHFEFDRYDLRADARETLKVTADWLKKNPSIRVEIEGHCDERGSNEYNLGLGAKRAAAAKDYLVALEISADRLSTVSYGEEIPACRERAEGCWEKNRRDRFVIVSVGPTS
ncbi:MAG TPA: peptidoglycan-associated lipoprotein Pal [Candidatus Udaeobacter sp.]|nr:peptidoglycan-associated lipoprotein Pal [Candidatus Udaeobacter sp.]